MSIDGCTHTFSDLAQTVLPAHMARLNEAIQHPWPASDFSQPGQGVATLAKRWGVPADFSGCYVLLDGTTPIYVGISRGVLNRLRQHMLGKDHFSASLAFAVARKRHGSPKGTRKQLMNADETPDFGTAFEQAQLYLRGLSVSAIRIDNPLELYIFEAYAAMELETTEWNTFRTH
ncbi:hypothetical protein GCM10027048_14040 [Hymenobacter coalescens]